VTIISVEQGYESTKGKQNYKIGLGITYREREALMNIGKFKDNYNKDRKPRYFNWNIYGHMAKNFWKLKKERKTRKCYKYNKVGYFTKNCRLEQKMKNRSI